MSLVNCMLGKRFNLLALAIFSAAFLFLVHGTAHAAPTPAPSIPIPSNTLPEASDFSQGNGVWLTVANQDGVNFLLNAHTNVVRIYSSQSAITLTITNGGHCSGGPDAGASEGTARTRFDVWRLAPIPQGGAYSYNSAPYIQSGSSAEATVYSNQVGCGSFTLNLNNINSANGFPGYSQNGKYAWEVDATWMNLGAYGWNSFKYNVNIGRFSYYSGSSDHFALKANDSLAYPGGTGTFKMGFAPNCLLAKGSTATVTLKWFDADAGQANQGGANPIHTYLYEYDGTSGNGFDGYPALSSPSGANLPGAGVIDITSGQNASGSVKVTLKGYHKYVWVWTGIRTANGIQFQLPTDSYNTLIDFNTGGECDQNNPTNFGATCTANGQTNLTVTATTAVTWKFNNTGTATWSTTNPTIQYRRYINSSFINATTVPSPIAPGGSFTRVVTETAPATGKKVIKYQMAQQSGGLIGTPCTVTISPPCTGSCSGGTAGGRITVSCSNITISGVNTSATQSATTGALQTIRRVPVVLRLTADDGTTYSWIVNDGAGNYGIPNQANGGSGGNSFPIYTYQIPGINFTMYPHESYTVELAIEGDPPSNSATYQDNGWWNPTNNANDGNFYYGIQIEDTETTPTDCLTAACGGTTSIDAEPGQMARNLQAGIQFTNKSTAGFPTNDPNAYQMVLNVNGGLKVSNVRYDNILPNATATSNVTFDAEVDYAGTYSVSLNFKGQPLDIGESVPCPTQSVQPKTRAFIEVTGGDIQTGGSFKQGTSCTSKVYPYYISPATTPGNSPYSGGIAAYGNHSTGLGSKARFGILSLGFDMGSFNGPIGLFTVDSVGSTSATLSNQTAQLGGLLNQTGVSDWHCAKDYYDTTQKTTPAPSTFSGGSVPSASLQYIANGTTTISASTIASGQQTTIYVNGDVNIVGDITYANSYDASQPNQIPYFILIAKGNIYIDSSVTQLDGLYVAQPDPMTGKGGVFSTCSSQSDFCNQQLIVNGAVLAQEVDLLREHGTMGPLNADPNGICAPTGSSNCPPAEIFNFIPAMVLGQPNLAPASSDVESLFSLPPVF